MENKNIFKLKFLELNKNRLRKKDKKLYTQKENYIFNVYKQFHVVEDAISNLYFFETLLTIEPFPKHFLEKNINEKDYYKFQLENFYIRCSSIFDFKMHFINTSLNLGFKKCSYELIKNNFNLENTTLKNKIINLYNYLNKVIEKRNKIIHHGKFDSELLDDITAYISIPNLPKELYDEEYELDSKDEKKRNIKKATEELNGITNNLNFHFEEILGELLPLIELQIQFYELKENN
jgi:hypothetical protein